MAEEDADTQAVTACLCFRDGGKPMLLEVEVPADAESKDIARKVLQAAMAADPARVAFRQEGTGTSSPSA